MPTFVSNSRLAYLTSLEAAAQALAGADVNLEECADASAMQAALTPAAPDEQAIGNAACDALLASASIEVAEDQSHEEALAAFAGQGTATEASHKMLIEAITAAGLTLPEASADAPLTAEAISASLKDQLDQRAVNKSISTVAAAGAKGTDVPETSDAGTEPKNGAELLATYEGMAPGEARTQFFMENKSALMSAMSSK